LRILIFAVGEEDELAGAWGVVEAMGWRRTRAFPVYFLESIPAMLIALVLTANLLNAILTLMVVFVFVLLGPAVIMGKIASDARVMGEYATRGVWKYAYWLSLGSVVGLGLVSVVSAL